MMNLNDAANLGFLIGFGAAALWGIVIWWRMATRRQPARPVWRAVVTWGGVVLVGQVAVAYVLVPDADHVWASKIIQVILFLAVVGSVDGIIRGWRRITSEPPTI